MGEKGNPEFFERFAIPGERGPELLDSSVEQGNDTTLQSGKSAGRESTPVGSASRTESGRDPD